MKRNWELIRKILLKLEQQPEASGYLNSDAIKGFAPRVVAYHFQILQQACQWSLKSAPLWAPKSAPL